MKLTFWGAAQTVTGSMHHVSANGQNYLLDCGTYQGRRQEARERNSHLPFPADSINTVALSHAHIDHSGNLPTLVKNGYRGPIFTSPATADLCNPMLIDSANVQEKDAMFVNRRSWRRKLVLGDKASEEQVEPIYSADDVEQTLQLFRTVDLHTPTEIGPGVQYESFDAGHMLGSTSMRLTISEAGRTVRLAFSGDIGRKDLPIIPDPETCPEADYLIIESTYGDRLHPAMERSIDKLGSVINRTCARGGKIIVPAFAVGRTQQLVLMLHELMNEQRIPSIPMFVDSPLATKTTGVYRRHLEAYDKETIAFAKENGDPFGFKRLTYIDDVNQSKGLNDLRGPFLVIASSGMCEAGRILHHLRHNISDPRNTVLITGFQAENTLGRKIVRADREVPIFGDPVRVRAEVVALNELSGHGDQHDLLNWIQPMAPKLKKIFLVHGELPEQQALAVAIKERFGNDVHIPARGDSFDLD